jgi:carbon monoxide dehydrogenase subunit G
LSNCYLSIISVTLFDKNQKKEQPRPAKGKKGNAVSATTMKLSGTYTFNAEQQTVWKLLMDPDAIARALPGVEKLTPVEGEPMTWKATIKLGLAMISGTFSGTIRITEIQAPERYRLAVNGEGQQSIIDGSALIMLTPDPGGAAKTALNWEGAANISGRLAGIGQRLIGSVATMMANQFFGGIAKQLSSA